MVGPKTLQFSAIFNSHLTLTFWRKMFLHSSRFLCPGLRAQLFVCGMVRVPSVEVTDLVATFCFLKPRVKNLCNRVSFSFWFLLCQIILVQCKWLTDELKAHSHHDHTMHHLPDFLARLFPCEIC